MSDIDLSSLREECISQRRQGEWSVEGYRERFEVWARSYPPAPDLKIERLDIGGVEVHRVEAPNARPDYHMLYFHGGGYVACSASTHNVWAGDLSRAAGATVWNVDYRIAPESQFPAALDDTVAAYRTLVSEGLITPETTVFAGESAGGGLVVATMSVLRDAGDPLPAGGVCLSPWVDLACSGVSLITNQDTDPVVRQKGLQRASKLYMGDHDPLDPLASPLYGDLSRIAPLLIQVATTETLLSDATRLAAEAESAGVRIHLECWEGALHFWQGFGDKFELARSARAAIADFVQCCIEGRTYASPKIEAIVSHVDLVSETISLNIEELSSNQ